jgi:hypothetical protein
MRRESDGGVALTKSTHTNRRCLATKNISVLALHCLSCCFFYLHGLDTDVLNHLLSLGDIVEGWCDHRGFRERVYRHGSFPLMNLKHDRLAVLLVIGRSILSCRRENFGCPLCLLWVLAGLDLVIIGDGWGDHYDIRGWNAGLPLMTLIQSHLAFL